MDHTSRVMSPHLVHLELRLSVTVTPCHGAWDIWPTLQPPRDLPLVHLGIHRHSSSHAAITYLTYICIYTYIHAIQHIYVCMYVFWLITVFAVLRRVHLPRCAAAAV